MRLYKDSEPIELSEGGIATVFGDRVFVRTDEGTFTGVAVRDGNRLLVSYRGQVHVFETSKPRSAAVVGGGDEVRAPMPGLVIEVLAKVGDEVSLGQRLAVLEAMKTQQPLSAPRDGKVSEVLAAVSDQVQQGQVIVRLETTQVQG